MSCDVNKFVISKGVDNTFIFTIKQDNSTLPMLIDVSDTFNADLVSLTDGSIYPQVSDKALTVFGNLINGQISLFISAVDTAAIVINRGSLVGGTGAAVNRQYLLPAYKLVIKCNTVANGNFIAKIPEIYAD